MIVQVFLLLCGQRSFLVFRQRAIADKLEHVVGVIAPLIPALLSMIVALGRRRAVALTAAIADHLDDNDRGMVVVCASGRVAVGTVAWLAPAVLFATVSAPTGGPCTVGMPVEAPCT